MNTKRAGVELPSQLLSNRLILGIIASYALAFIVFSFLMSSPGEILGVADLRYESSCVGFLKPRPKLTFGWVQGCHSYLDSATPTF
ncbi:hypothetical protein [Microcystis aeruginosa]|jgi:hypothetical protein|uniref:Uncharacterized protein n=1 Tax=Microcystis aeruginosa FD4 TaxID=2686288 RepID=A0A857D6A4_MICAE|nr:hypothetical protein [Microcystis aeruginosa]MDB9422725.1 hypothetical protein [Microcystis aeruginosa CS-563/04]QGZ91428.1 hypothetical protein GQR42_19825 [Microcystis aeruginosa FD4]